MLKTIQFAFGRNINAQNLNELQDNLSTHTYTHKHSGLTEGPLVWADFASILNTSGDSQDANNSLNKSILDHVRDETIHNGTVDASSSGETFVTQNRMGFGRISPGDWVWKGFYWETQVDLPPGLYNDCEYIVYFQPYYTGSYKEFYEKLNEGAHFASLQGCVPLRNKLLDFTLIAHSMSKDSFQVRMFAIGKGTRWEVSGRSEDHHKVSDWAVDRIVDGTLSRPTQIQAIDDRLYVLSSGNNKIIIFSTKSGYLIDAYKPPADDKGNTKTIRSFGVCRFVRPDDRADYSTTISYSDGSADVWDATGIRTLRDVPDDNGWWKLINRTLVGRSSYTDGYFWDYGSIALGTMIDGGRTIGKLKYSISEQLYDSANPGQDVEEKTDFNLAMPNGDFFGYTNAEGYGVNSYLGSSLLSWGQFARVGATWPYPISSGITAIRGWDFSSDSATYTSGDYGREYKTETKFPWDMLEHANVMNSGAAATLSTLGVILAADANTRSFATQSGDKYYLHPMGYEYLELPGRPVAISGTVLPRKYKESGATFSVALIMVVFADQGGLTDSSVDSTTFQIYALKFDGTDHEMVQLGTPEAAAAGFAFYGDSTQVLLNQSNNTDTLLGCLRDMGCKSIVDVYIGITGPSSGEVGNETERRIIAYFSDPKSGRVYAVRTDWPALVYESNTKTYLGTSSLFKKWVRDEVKSGIFEGFQSIVGSNSIYSGDYPVMPYYTKIAPSESDTESYHDYYNQQMWAYRQNFNYWPSTSARRAKYSILSDGVVNSGDYLNGLIGSDNPLANLGCIFYTKPTQYVGKENVSDCFALDPRYLRQIMVYPYQDPVHKPYDEAAKPYLAYTPVVVNNAYTMMNSENTVNTFVNTFFLINDPDIDYIDLYFDFGQAIRLGTITEDNLISWVYSSNMYQINDEWSNFEDDETNFKKENFLLGLIQPHKGENVNEFGGSWTYKGPAGWNWSFLDWEGNYYFNPVYDEGQFRTLSDFYSISEVTVDENYVVKMTLALTTSFKQLIASSCSTHGIEPGMPVPFGPTVFNHQVLPSGDAEDGLIELAGREAGFAAYDSSGNLITPPLQGGSGGSSGWDWYWTNSSGEKSSIGAPVGALGNYEKGVPYSQYKYKPFKTVQMYDWPMSKGGLWCYIATPPFRYFPKYISQFVDWEIDELTPYCGEQLPLFHAATSIEDIKQPYSKVVHNDGGDLDERYLMVNNFSYYKTLRRIVMRKNV